MCTVHCERLTTHGFFFISTKAHADTQTHSGAFIFLFLIFPCGFFSLFDSRSYLGVQYFVKQTRGCERLNGNLPALPHTELKTKQFLNKNRIEIYMGTKMNKR